MDRAVRLELNFNDICIHCLHISILYSSIDHRVEISFKMTKYCCNPFNKPNHGKHARSNYKNLRPVTRELANNAKCLNINLVENVMKICGACRVKLVRDCSALSHQVENIFVGQAAEMAVEVQDVEMSGEEQQNVENDVDIGLHNLISSPGYSSRLPTPHTSDASSSTGYFNKAEFITEFNKILPLIGVDPIDLGKIKKSMSYCQHTINDIMTNLRRKLFEMPEIDANVQEANAEEEMVNQLKSKFAESTAKDEKVRILSVLPKSWSARKIANTFNTTIHMAILAKKLVVENGILCSPNQRVGTNVIDQETVTLVKDFFLSDDISRVCPGKRDYITVNESNIKISKQRRLILMNLAEAYAIFKQQNIGRKIGFSKFASLRPPECILALNNLGTHSVCVCAYHQNVKLIFYAMKRTMGMDTYRDLLKKMLCVSPDIDCYLNHCQNCPGIKEMERFLNQLLEANEIGNVSYKQWINQGGENFKRNTM